MTDLTLQLGQANAKLAEAQSSIATITSKLAKTGTIPNRPTTSPNGPVDMTGPVGIVVGRLGLVPVLASFEVSFVMDDCAYVSFAFACPS